MKRVNVGLTGLSRTGKTVFLTAAVYHLTELVGDHLEEFRFHGWKYHGIRGKIRKSAELFSYKEKLAALRSEEPAWPEPTVDVTEYPIHLQLINNDGTRQECQIDFLDYPGERLLDVALLETTYEEWCDDLYDRLGSAEGLMYEAGQQWEANLNSVLEERTEFPKARVRAVKTAFGALCNEAAKLGNPIAPIEPVLKPTSTGEVVTPFFPMHRKLRERFPDRHRTEERFYNAYVNNSAKPFLKQIGLCDHQLVLVDVLGILNAGVDRYASVREQMHRILLSYRNLNRGWTRWFASAAQGKLSRPGISRVTFCATKADQAQAPDRSNLDHLLRELFAKAQTGLEFDHRTLRGFNFMHVSACRCAEDVNTTSGSGEPVYAIRGRTAETPSGELETLHPSQIPEKWPRTKKEWRTLSFPELLPRKGSDLPDQPLPHINMDKVLFELLETVF